MAKDWLKQDVDQWVERWWDSGLTSLHFVSVESLPISARTLRSHGERHFAEVLRELRELRALVAARGAVVQRDGEPDQPAACCRAPSTDEPPGVASLPLAHPVEQVGELATRAVSEFIFDLDDDQMASEEVSPASRVFGFDLDADQATRHMAKEEGAAESGAHPSSVAADPTGQVVSQEESPRGTGPFLFDVEVW